LSYPVLTNKQQLMRFLGIAGYYHCFCENFSVIVASLTNLLKKRQDYQWIEGCQSAFQSVKMMLSSKPVLWALVFQQLFYLMVDASNLGAGAVLMQWGIEHPLCYCSQNLIKIIEKEALALLFALQYFDVYLIPLYLSLPIIILSFLSIKW